MKRLGKSPHRYLIITGLVLFFIATIFINVWIRKEGFAQKEKNYMEGVDVIYWINLDRSNDRKKNMLKVLADPVFQNIPNIRISATDGKNPDEMYSKITDFKKQKDTSDSEYGCLLSHLDSIRKFNDSEYNVALIFEDDVTLEFRPFWKNSIQTVIDSAPEDWEIILLWYDVKDEGFFNETIKKYDGECYTLSYIINKSGSNKLMKNCLDNEKYVLDNNLLHKSDIFIYRLLTTFVYKYPMFIYRTDNDSNIHPHHVEAVHNVHKRNAISSYKKETQ
jgi:GR25 family glycosyltransferase involved in LPS biosynthesis